MNKQRDVTFDFLKSIAIFLVIWGHSMALGPNDVYHNINGRWIVLINMPLFLFIVGYFSISSIKRSIREILCNKWKTLIIPTLIYGITMSLPRLFVYNGLVISSLWGGVSRCLIEPYWFIWAIICCLLYYKCFDILFSQYLNMAYLAVISWAILMLLPHTIESYLISKVQSLYPFFLTGIIFRKFRLFEKISPYSLISVFLCIVILGMLYIVFKPNQYFYHFQYMDTTVWLLSYFMMLLAGLAGIIICFFISKKLSHLKNSSIFWLNEIGQFTLAIYLEQTVVFSFLNYTGAKLSNDLEVFILAVMIYLCLSFLTKIISQNKSLSKILLGKIKTE